MKTRLYLLAVLSVCFAVVSCNKTELDNSETLPATSVKLVPMTFSATKTDDGVDDDTRVVLDGLSFVWEVGDEIAIYDDIDPSTPHPFTASVAGTTTSFNGLVSEGATKFFAVYPSSAAVDCDMTPFSEQSYSYWGKMNVAIPSEQKAIAGTFDPDAAVLVASTDSEEGALRFRIPFTLGKFTVDYDDINSVSFSSEKNMTGSLNVKMRDNGNIGTGDGSGDKFKELTLKTADGTPFVKGTTYYAVMRYRTGNNAYTDFTATLANTSAGYASKTASSGVEMERGKVHSLGNFSGLSFKTSRYRSYQDGAEITIADKVYKKSVNGDASLLSDGGIFKTEITGVVFVDASASVSNTSEVKITGDVVLTSDDPEHPGTYTCVSGKSFLLESGSLVMDNLTVNMTAITSGQFLTKKDNTGNFSSLTLNQCDFKAISRYIFTPNSSYLTYGIESIKINGCNFGADAAVQLFAVNSSATTLAGYKDFTFTNNVFYSTTGEAQQSYIFSTSAANIAESTCHQEVIIDNNLFYNIAASSGIFRTHYLKSIYIRNNILWAVNGTYNSNIKMFKANLKTADASVVFEGGSSDNYCYGDLGGKSWTISDSDCRGPLTNVTTITTDPIQSFDAATGAFVIINDYKSYGPQR